MSRIIFAAEIHWLPSGLSLKFTNPWERLMLFPNMGRRQSVEGVRRLVTRRYSYLVYYTIDDTADEIIILNVKHPARRREYSDL